MKAQKIVIGAAMAASVIQVPAGAVEGAHTIKPGLNLDYVASILSTCRGAPVSECPTTPNGMTNLVVAKKKTAKKILPL